LPAKLFQIRLEIVCPYKEIVFVIEQVLLSESYTRIKTQISLLSSLISNLRVTYDKMSVDGIYSSPNHSIAKRFYPTKIELSDVIVLYSSQKTGHFYQMT
jgi:hypothetical protein